MNRSLLKVFLAFAMLLAFTLVSVSAFAAEKKYFVVKDAKGVCAVRHLKEKSAKSIAGPFDKKEDAEKSKKELCPKKEKKEKSQEKKH
ncbi:MAG: hypothetical protein ACLPVO_02025 [Desulfomonilaceae bacterium]|jgi:hypothetical protein|nr:hypothetical protein [Syntrophaceae bacterium]